jgi:hypothetical protein
VDGREEHLRGQVGSVMSMSCEISLICDDPIFIMQVDMSGRE